MSPARNVPLPAECCSRRLIPNYLQSCLKTVCLSSIQVAPFSTITALILSMFFQTQSIFLAFSSPPIEMEPILPPSMD
jgi:hypothetical protein